MGRGRIFVLLRLESNKPSDAHGHRCWVATGAYAFRRRPMPTCLLCRALPVSRRHCRHGVCFTLRVHFYLITNVPRLCGPGVPGGAIEFEMIVDRTVLRDAANATSSALRSPFRHLMSRKNTVRAALITVRAARTSREESEESEDTPGVDVRSTRSRLSRPYEKRAMELRSRGRMSGGGKERSIIKRVKAETKGSDRLERRCCEMSITLVDDVD